MSIILDSRPVSEVLSPHRIVWTRDDCERFVAAGLLNYRFELVEGTINRMGQKLPHSIGISSLTGWFYRILGEDYVQSQATIDVSPEDNPTSEPMPDVCLLNVSLRQLIPLQICNPRPEHIRLLVEVADSTLQYDLTTKAGLYARANIPVYWVLSLPERCVHVFTSPANGVYTQRSRVEADQTISVPGLPQNGCLVVSLLP